MKVNGNTIKPGNVIEHKNGLWVATKTSHVKPGKGGAFAQIELRNLKDGTKLNINQINIEVSCVVRRALEESKKDKSGGRASCL